MSEGKSKKNGWLSWAVIAAAFLAIIFYLLFSYMKNGKEAAMSQAMKDVSTYTSEWAQKIFDNLEDAEEYGAVIQRFMNEEDLDVTDDNLYYYVSNIKTASNLKSIAVGNTDGQIFDENGKQLNIELPFEISEDTVKQVGYYYLQDDGLGVDSSFMVYYPLEKDGEFILFYYGLDELTAGINGTGMDDKAFALVFKKDGTILGVLDGCKDKDSQFLRADNFVSAVQEGCEKREEFNLFKSKFYACSTCYIKSTYKDDARTIAVSSIGANDWYVGIGVRQFEVDRMAQDDFKTVKSTVVKLSVVLALFTLFIIGTVIINSIRSVDKSRKLEDKADTDLLTELTNKAATERMIGEYITQNPSGRGLLFILDIDNFKKVNDTMGHAFGDTLLKTLGKEIRMEFRVTDIVGRTGGDEFMIFLKDLKDDLIVEREANRITRFFHDFKAGGDYVKYSATASIGAAIFPEDGATFKDLYVSADQALYRAKKRGKNQLVFFNEDKYGK